MKKNYYEILGVNPSATLEEIQKKYRELVKKYHPDICKDHDAAEKIKEINIAYDTLCNKEKRKQYDIKISTESNTEKQNEEVNFDEELNNLNNKEKENVKKIAFQEMLKECLNTINDIKLFKNNIFESLISEKIPDEDDYLSEVEKWWELASSYIKELNKLKVEAETLDMSYCNNSINEVINEMLDEMKNMPLSILDAKNYISSHKHKLKILNEAKKTIASYYNTLENYVNNMYEKIVFEFINNENYQTFKNSELSKLIGMNKKLITIKKIYKIYKYDQSEINNINNLLKTIEKAKSALQSDFSKLKKIALDDYASSKIEEVCKNIDIFENEIYFLENNMKERIGNIVTKSEILELENKFKVIKSDINLLNMLAKKREQKIDFKQELGNNIETKMEKFKLKREEHLRVFFDLYDESKDKNSILSVMFSDNKLLTGANILVGAAAITSLVIKKPNISIPVSAFITGLNITNSYLKAKIYKQNVIKAKLIIDRNDDTKTEYEEYLSTKNKQKQKKKKN